MFAAQPFSRMIISLLNFHLAYPMYFDGFHLHGTASFLLTSTED
jgi:hypothetical protein